MPPSSTPATPAPSAIPAGSPDASNADSRLVRAVGVWGLAASIVNITIGGGIFRLPSTAAKLLGDGAPIAYIACSIAMVLVVLCFAEAGSRVSQTGGPYASTEVAFGPMVGFVVGVLLWAGITAATGAVSTFFADALAGLVPSLAGTFARDAVIVIVLSALAAANVVGVTGASRLNTVTTLAKLGPIAVFLIAGIATLHSTALHISHTPPVGDVGRASVVLIFAFLGVETALVPSGEVRQPARTIPRAILIAIIVVAVIYLLIQVIAQSALGSALPLSSNAVADAAGAVMGPNGRTMILVGAVISMFGYLGGMTLAVPRMLFALGRDGFLPSSFARVHPKWRTPVVAIVVQTIIHILLAVTGTFEQLAILANGAVLLAYAGACASVIQLRRRAVHGEEPPFVLPGSWAIPVAALAIIAFFLTSLSMHEWFAVGGVAVASVAVYVTRNAMARA